MDPKEITKGILKMLESGWNNGDGTAFARPFAEKSEFVDISGTLHQGQPPAYIGAAHNGLFNSIYKDSKVSYEMVQAMMIDTNTILANAKTELNAPSGPLAGKNNSTITLVITKEGNDWKIRGFQNTLVMKR